MEGFKSVKHFNDSDITLVFDEAESRLRGAFYKEETNNFMTLADEKIIKQLYQLDYFEEETPAVSSGSLGMGAQVNVVPSSRNSRGRCSQILIVYCFSKAKLNDRLREMVYHLGIHCHGVTNKVLIMTNQWDNGTWDIHAPAIEALVKQQNIAFFKAQLEGTIFNKSQLF